MHLHTFLTISTYSTLASQPASTMSDTKMTTTDGTRTPENNNQDIQKEESSSSSPMATIGEVFSFVEDTKTKVYIGCGFLFATIAGLALPSSLFLFADVLGDVSAVAEEGLEPGQCVRSLRSLR